MRKRRVAVERGAVFIKIEKGRQRVRAKGVGRGARHQQPLFPGDPVAIGHRLGGESVAGVEEFANLSIIDPGSGKRDPGRK